MLRSLFATCLLCTAGSVWTPEALAQTQSTSCTLRAPVDIFSKPKGQGRRTRLNAGTALEILNHSGNWYTVYTGSAEAFLAASAYTRACAAPTRASPQRPKPAANDLIDLPLEPLPTAPAAPSNPMPVLPSGSELKSAPPPAAAQPPAPAPTPTQQVPQAAPALPKRIITAPPSSAFEPPAPLLDQTVIQRGVWTNVEYGLWWGGGAALIASAALYTSYRVYGSGVGDDINAYNSHNNDVIHSGTADPNFDATQQHNQVVSEVSTVEALGILSGVTFGLGVAALGTALGLHFWGPEAVQDGADSNSVAMPVPLPTLRIGWRRVAIEGTF